MTTRRRHLVGIFGGLALLASCGVPAERSADVFDDESVPFGLLDADRQPVAGTNAAGRAVELYLYDVEAEVLRPVTRRVEDDSPAAVIAQLEEELLAAETSADVRSPLAGVDAVRSAEVDEGVVTIDLSEEFSQISGADQLIAVAQLVYTSTARPGIGQVSFTLEGARVEVPLGDGSLTTGNVTREDYAALAP